MKDTQIQYDQYSLSKSDIDL